MLENAKFTAFTVSELLRENQQGVKLTLPPPRLRLAKPFKDYGRSYNNQILNSSNPTIHISDTKSYNKNKIKSFLEELKGFKF